MPCPGPAATVNMDMLQWGTAVWQPGKGQGRSPKARQASVNEGGEAGSGQRGRRNISSRWENDYTQNGQNFQSPFRPAMCPRAVSRRRTSQRAGNHTVPGTKAISTTGTAGAGSTTWEKLQVPPSRKWNKEAS